MRDKRKRSGFRMKICFLQSRWLATWADLVLMARNLLLSLKRKLPCLFIFFFLPYPRLLFVCLSNILLGFRLNYYMRECKTPYEEKENALALYDLSRVSEKFCKFLAYQASPPLREVFSIIPTQRTGLVVREREKKSLDLVFGKTPDPSLWGSF